MLLPPGGFTTLTDVTIGLTEVSAAMVFPYYTAGLATVFFCPAAGKSSIFIFSSSFISSVFSPSIMGCTTTGFAAG